MIGLYEASVESSLRVLGATIGVLKKAEQHFAKSGRDLAEIVKLRIAPDMFPFSFQVYSVRHHSLHSAQGLLSGSFGPPKDLPETDYAGLIRVLEVAQQELSAIPAEAIDARAGQSVVFEMGSLKLPFTAENFVLSFSLPNLYFHATTTYGLLRAQGVPLGKVDFMGRMKVGVPG